MPTATRFWTAINKKHGLGGAATPAEREQVGKAAESAVPANQAVDVPATLASDKPGGLWENVRGRYARSLMQPGRPMTPEEAEAFRAQPAPGEEDALARLRASDAPITQAPDNQQQLMDVYDTVKRHAISASQATSPKLREKHKKYVHSLVEKALPGVDVDSIPFDQMVDIAKSGGQLSDPVAAGFFDPPDEETKGYYDLAHRLVKPAEDGTPSILSHKSQDAMKELATFYKTSTPEQRAKFMEVLQGVSSTVVPSIKEGGIKKALFRGLDETVQSIGTTMTDLFSGNEELKGAANFDLQVRTAVRAANDIQTGNKSLAGRVLHQGAIDAAGMVGYMAVAEGLTPPIPIKGLGGIAGATSKEAAKRAAIWTGLQAAKRVPGAVGVAAVEYPQKKAEWIEAGFTDSQAKNWGVVSAGLSGAIEQFMPGLGMKGATSGAVAKGVNKRLVEWAIKNGVKFGEEWSEEGMEAVKNVAMEALANKVANTKFDLKKDWDKQIGDALDSAIPLMMMQGGGVAMSGVSEASQGVQEGRQAARIRARHAILQTLSPGLRRDLRSGDPDAVARGWKALPEGVRTAISMNNPDVSNAVAELYKGQKIGEDYESVMPPWDSGEQKPTATPEPVQPEPVVKQATETAPEAAEEQPAPQSEQSTDNVSVTPQPIADKPFGDQVADLLPDIQRVFGRRQDAEDLANDVVVKALEAEATYDPAKGSLKSWLRTLAKNHLRNQSRKEGAAKKVPLTEDLEPVAEPEEQELPKAFSLDDLRAEDNDELTARWRALHPRANRKPPVNKEELVAGIWKKTPQDLRVEKTIGQKPETSAQPTIKTTTGRQIPPPKQFKPESTDRVAANTVKARDRWLVEQAIAEADSRGDDYAATIFKGDLKSKTLPQASRDSMNDYLFGETWPEFDAATGDRIQKPESAPEDAAVPPAQDIERRTQLQQLKPEEVETVWRQTTVAKKGFAPGKAAMIEKILQAEEAAPAEPVKQQEPVAEPENPAAEPVAKKPLVSRPQNDPRTTISDLYANRKPITDMTQGQIAESVDNLAALTKPVLQKFAVEIGMSTYGKASKTKILADMKMELQRRREFSTRSVQGAPMVEPGQVTEPAKAIGQKAEQTPEQVLRSYAHEKGYSQIVGKGQPGYRSQKNKDLINARDSDRKYEELLQTVNKQRRSLATKEGKEETAAERAKGLADAEAGKVTEEAVIYAPVHELPPEMRIKIQAEAQILLEETKSENVKKALQKIIKDAGSDVGGAVEDQKERIIGRIRGGIDSRPLAARDAMPPRDPDPLVELLLAETPEKRVDMATAAIESIEAGSPNALAREAQRTYEETTDDPFAMDEDVIGYLRELAKIKEPAAEEFKLDATSPEPKPKAEPSEFESQGGKQPTLFAGGLPGQMNLFPDTGVPDAMVSKETRPTKAESAAERAAREADESRPTGESYGTFGGGTITLEPVRDDSIPDSVKAPRKDVERQLAAARSYREPGRLDRMRELAVTTKNVVTRAQEHLPRDGEHAIDNEFFRLLKNVGPVSQDEAIRRVATIVDPLGEKQGLLFERYLIVQNQLAAIEMGQPLRFGFESKEEVQAYRDQLQGLVERTPAVQKALESRKAIIRETVQQAVDYGLLPEKAMDNVDTYYHQQVHFYLVGQERNVTGTRVGQVRRGFQKARVEGESLDEQYNYNTSYVEAETAWLTDALVEIGKEKLFLDLMEKRDSKDQYKQTAKSKNFEELVGGKEIVNRIEHLRGQIAESQASEDRNDSAERMQRKAWIEELQDIDPTYPYRAQIAKMAAILRKRLGLDVDEDYSGDEDVGEPGWWRIVKEQADAGEPAALGLFKAIGERNAFIKEQLGSKFLTWKDIAKESGSVVFQPEPGNMFYHAFTIPDRLVEALQSEAMDALEISKDDLREVVAMAGPKRQFAIPEELAAQLEATRKGELPHGLASAADKMMKSWKIWTLLNPKRLWAYNLRNFTGDIDPIVAAAPGAIEYSGRAMNELRQYHQGRLSLSPMLRLARDLGVIGSGFTAEEIPDLKDLVVFRRFFDQRRGKKSLGKAIGGYFKTVKKYTSFREDTLRYAAFLYYVDRLKRGELKHYGAARKDVVDSLAKEMGIEVAAAHLARELLGDYGNINVAGDYIRRRWIPFWAFQEINLKRYPRMFINAWQAGEGKGRAAGTMSAAVARGILTSRIAWMYGSLWIWNNLVMPMVTGDDDEQDLPPYDRANPHLLLGRNPDGSVRRFRNVGAMGDFLEWFGLNEAVSLLKKRGDDQISDQEIVTEMLKAPWEKVGGSLRPELDLFVQGAGGLSIFPEVFNWRATRRDEALPGALGLVDEYRWAKGVILKDGTRPRKYYWQRWGLGVSDPRQDALSNIYEARSDFMVQQGKQEKGIYPISKYKEARDAFTNEDQQAFMEWKDKFKREFGDGSREKFKAFLQGLDPIASKMTDKDEMKFETEFLNSEQRQQLQVAKQYATEMRDTLMTWWDDTEGPVKGKRGFQVTMKDQVIGGIAFRATTPPSDKDAAELAKEMGYTRQQAKKVLQDKAAKELADMGYSYDEAVAALKRYWLDTYGPIYSNGKLKESYTKHVVQLRTLMQPKRK